MMRNVKQAMLGVAWAVVAVALCGGCTTPQYAATPYKPNPDKYGPISLTATKSVFLCPVIDHLGEDSRKALDPSFSVPAYIGDAVRQELTTAGSAPTAAPFAIGSSFAKVQDDIAQLSDKTKAAVYMAVQVVYFGPTKITIDTKMCSEKGQVLFEKRGLCCILDDPGDEQKASRKDRAALSEARMQTITHMTVRQIINDPAFQGVLQ